MILRGQTDLAREIQVVGVIVCKNLLKTKDATSFILRKEDGQLFGNWLMGVRCILITMH